MKKSIILGVALAIAATGAFAQQVKVATGSPKGTYHALYSNIAEACGNEMAVVGVNTSGSLENLDKLTAKEVSAAFVQTDALFASAQGRDLGNVKTLVAFHKEAAHVVVAKNSGIKSGGVAGFGGKDVTFNTAEDLSGYKIAVAGGSMITAQLVKMQGQINWTIVPVDSNDAAIEALNEKQVQAVLMVGGQPLGNVRALSGDFKLIGFKPQTVELLKTVYVADKLSYPKLSTSAVNTIATEALLVSRVFNTSTRIAELTKFRQCVLKNIPIWQDADGAHPAWSNVSVENRGKWAYYDLPSGKK